MRAKTLHYTTYLHTGPDMFNRNIICFPYNGGYRHGLLCFLQLSAYNLGVIFRNLLLVPGFHCSRLALTFAERILTLSITVFNLFFVFIIVYNILIVNAKFYSVYECMINYYLYEIAAFSNSELISSKLILLLMSAIKPSTSRPFTYSLYWVLKS